MMDIGPAILELAGIGVPDTFEAESVLPALTRCSPRPAADLGSASPLAEGVMAGAFPQGVARGVARAGRFLQGVHRAVWRLLRPKAAAEDSWPGREYVFAEHGRDGILQEAEFVTMVRSRKWKLVHFLDQPFGQLFDLANDPGEKVNLWDEPAADGAKQELLRVLLEWRIRSGYGTRSWAEDAR
jgi:arylsulfatase A-like enzyme